MTRLLLAALGVAAAAAAIPAAPQYLKPGQPLPGMAPADPGPVTVRNPGFEEAPVTGRKCLPGWDCVMHVSSDSFRFFLDDSQPAAGAHSGCFESVGREPWGKMVQGLRIGPGTRGKRVRLSALVRLDGVTGEGAGPILRASGGGGNELASRFEAKPGTSGWQPVSAELDVPDGAYVLELGFALRGKGRICVDEVRFEVLPARPAV